MKLKQTREGTEKVEAMAIPQDRRENKKRKMKNDFLETTNASCKV